VSSSNRFRHARIFAPQDLTGQREVRDRTTGMSIVQQHRSTVRRIPNTSSRGFTESRTCSIVLMSDDRPSSA
jgi:hypothetical protein